MGLLGMFSSEQMKNGDSWVSSKGATASQTIKAIILGLIKIPPDLLSPLIHIDKIPP